MPLHEAAAPEMESGLKEALQEEEEGVASHEVEGGDMGANRLHDIPRELPKNTSRSGHEKNQPAP